MHFRFVELFWLDTDRVQSRAGKLALNTFALALGLQDCSSLETHENLKELVETGKVIVFGWCSSECYC